jgi:hypothetical protein
VADNVVVDNGGLTDYTVSTDEAASGQVARVKLAYSADGSDTHVDADADGLLVNLGANNDVVASGTVTVGGTPTVTIGGTPDVNLASGTAIFSGSITAGTALMGYTGISADGTAIVDVLSLTSGTAVAVGLYDTTGTQINFTNPGELTDTPTLGTASAVAQYDSLHTTIMTFTGAANSNGGSGRILGARLVCKHDTFADEIQLHVFRKSVTGTTALDALAVSDGDKDECVGSLTFDFSAAAPLGGGRVANADRSNLPLDYVCDAGTDDLYGILQATGTSTPTFAASDLVPYLNYIAD